VQDDADVQDSSRQREIHPPASVRKFTAGVRCACRSLAEACRLASSHNEGVEDGNRSLALHWRRHHGGGDRLAAAPPPDAPERQARGTGQEMLAHDGTRHGVRTPDHHSLSAPAALPREGRESVIVPSNA
jgi:hypothetical protein